MSALLVRRVGRGRHDEAGRCLRAPLAGPRLVFRVLDDLNAIAENARRQPDVVDEIKARLDELLLEVAALTSAARKLDARAGMLDGTGNEVAVQAREIVRGGRELNDTGLVLDGHAEEIVQGGADLVAVARSLDETLLVFREHLPRAMRALDTVEQLEGAAETLADTMEPLQGAAERVGRVTKRLSRH